MRSPYYVSSGVQGGCVIGQQGCGLVQATRGPTEGELNVEAFEGQLRAVEQLAASLTVKTVLTPTSPESDFSQLASQAVTAQVHSLESLLTSYCAAQKGVSLQIDTVYLLRLLVE